MSAATLLSFASLFAPLPAAVPQDRPAPRVPAAAREEPDPSIVELARAIEDAARADDHDALAVLYEAERVVERAEERLDGPIDAEGRRLGRTVAVPDAIASMLWKLRTHGDDATLRARFQRRLASGAREVVVRQRDPDEAVDRYFWLVVEDTDGACVVVDHWWEDDAFRASEEVALRLASRGWDEALVERFEASGPVHRRAWELLNEGEAQRALDALRSIEQEVVGLPAPAPAVFRATRMRAAYTAGETELALRDARFLRTQRPRCALASLVVGRVSLDRGRHAVARRWLAHYRSAVGGDALSLELTGNSHELEGDTDAAVRSWLAALDENPDLVHSLAGLGRYLTAERHDELVERCRATTPPFASLEDLFADWWNAGRCDAVRAVSRAAREAAEPDANAWYYEAECALEEGDAGHAAELAREGLRFAPADEREYYARLWTIAAVEHDDPLDVYRRSADRATTFDALCEHLLYEEGDRSVVLDLIDLREEDDPDDPWLPFYRGELLQSYGELDDAEDEYVEGAELARDRGRQECLEIYRRSRANLLWRTRGSVDVYREMPGADVYGWLAGWDLDLGDSAALRRLSGARAEDASEDPRVTYFRACADLLDGEEDDALERYRRCYRELIDEPELATDAEFQLIELLLDRDRVDEALEVARASTARDGDPYYELHVHAVTGDVLGTIDAFRRCLPHGYGPGDVYDDPDFGEAVRNDPGFAPFREQWPPR